MYIFLFILLLPGHSTFGIVVPSNVCVREARRFSFPFYLAGEFVLSLLMGALIPGKLGIATGMGVCVLSLLLVNR
jgi:hypothetical protein